MRSVRPATLFAIGLGASALVYLVYLGWRGVPWAVADSAAGGVVTGEIRSAQAAPSAAGGTFPQTCAEWAALTAGKGPAILQTVNGQPVARVYVTTCTDDEAGIRLVITGG